MRSLFALFLACSLPSLVLGWGAAGHAVVATIAQIHLHPHAQSAVHDLLKREDLDGQLAKIASWADRVRMIPEYRFAGELHYTSPLEDYPPAACHFGDQGWKTTHDVLHAITNYTTRLIDNPHDGIALRFLVHFIGDSHQPLHLTNRERGGNGLDVRWEGRKMNLHSVWDNGFITKKVREQRNYTERLPSAQIEEYLTGTIYDPFIRLILWEGVRLWWRSSLPSWLTCSPPLSSTSLSSSSQLLLSSSSNFNKGKEWESICPEEWGAETHKVTCERTFTFVGNEGYNGSEPLLELNTESYYGPIREHNTIEKLLAQGGLRLAAALNAIFVDPEEEELKRGASTFDKVNLIWMEEEAAQV